MRSKRSGFTLIELLIVIVVVGILAMMALPKLTRMREKAYYKAIASDLRNLSTQQELYFTLPHVEYAYAENADDLPDFTRSDGVEVEIVEATGSGWVATATHQGLPAGRECGVYQGTVSSKPEWLTAPGLVTCMDE